MTADDPLSEQVGDGHTPYDDDDLMPFGKYKNERMMDVPASYFHWLWQNRPISDRRIELYIKENLDALKEEHEDGIW